MDTATQSLSPLSDSSVNNTLVKVVPFLKQSFFQIINVTDPPAVHSLLLNAPDRSKRLTEATDQFFLGNSATIFSTISFSNCETFNYNMLSYRRDTALQSVL